MPFDFLFPHDDAFPVPSGGFLIEYEDFATHRGERIFPQPYQMTTDRRLGNVTADDMHNALMEWAAGSDFRAVVHIVTGDGSSRRWLDSRPAGWSLLGARP